jgi:glycosyltransferase involved in cell wall biosynthesis
VVLVTSQFPTPSEPERGIFTLQIATRLAAHCQLTVICPLPWFPALPILRPLRAWYRFAKVPSTWMQDGVRVIAPKYLMVPKLSERFHGRLIAARIHPLLTALRRREGIDLVNSHWLYPDSVAVHLALRGSSIPHVPTGLGCDVNEFIDDPMRGGQIRDMLAASPAVTVVAESLRWHLVARGIPADRVTTIPNGVDTSRFRLQVREDAQRRLGLEHDRERVLYVGRFAEEKAVATLVEAMAAVVRTRRRTELVLVGEGPLRRSLVDQARTLGIAEHVRFVGQQDHRRVADWMAAADCFCLPSAREGCPNVVLEALACGLPVVASEVGGIPEMVTSESGILVPPGSPPALGAAITKALGRTWNREAIARTVAARSWEGVASAYLNTYQRVMELQSRASSRGAP